VTDARRLGRPTLLLAALIVVSGCAGTMLESASAVRAPLTAAPTAASSAAILPTNVITVSAPAIAVPTPTIDLPAQTQTDGLPTPEPAVPIPATSTSAAAPPAAAPPAAAAPALAASRPVRLQIPAIGVDSGLLDLGLQDDGTMQVPPDAESAGWYTGAPTPGELGPAIIVAHVDWAGELGVFYDLRDLQEGDEITVTREDGSVAQFHATSIQQFEKTEFPTDAVYGDIDHAGLRLITCGGDFDPQARSYLDNIVVFAALQP
jgi:hypothetical protein